MAAAQVYQALACGLEPSVHMNPVLLKPEGDKKSELIVQGRSWGSFDTMGYYALKRRLLGQVANSFYRLCEGNDLVIVEGAGSCAEINLRRHDLANRFLSYLKAEPAATLIVADIERGGAVRLRPGLRKVTDLPLANLWQSPLHGDVFATLEDHLGQSAARLDDRGPVRGRQGEAWHTVVE